MPYQRPMENILAFRQTRTSPSEEVPHKAKQPKPKLHPVVRRRRLLWLGMMIFIFGWSIYQLIAGQSQIWEKEKILAARKAELASAISETNQLNQAIHLLNTEDYLLELAHKLGYSKPGEENYSTSKE